MKKSIMNIYGSLTAKFAAMALAFGLYNVAKGAELSLRYDDYYTFENATSVTSANTAIISTDGNTIHAGAVTDVPVDIAVTTGGTTTHYAITVGKAKVNVVLVSGQSNAMGTAGLLNGVNPITPDKGNGYWWTGSALTDLKTKVDSDVTANSSRSVGWYPALAAEWYALTGAKTIIVYQIASGAPISRWADYETGAVTSTTTSTANSVRNCIAFVKNSGNFEIVNAGYYWLQGETDAFLSNSEGITDYTTAQRYETAYMGMHNAYIAALNEADVSNVFGAILSCRTRSNISAYHAVESIGMRVA